MKNTQLESEVKKYLQNNKRIGEKLRIEELKTIERYKFKKIEEIKNEIGKENLIRKDIEKYNLEKKEEDKLNNEIQINNLNNKLNMKGINKINLCSEKRREKKIIPGVAPQKKITKDKLNKNKSGKYLKERIINNIMRNIFYNNNFFTTIIK